MELLELEVVDPSICDGCHLMSKSCAVSCRRAMEHHQKSEERLQTEHSGAWQRKGKNMLGHVRTNRNFMKLLLHLLSKSLRLEKNLLQIMIFLIFC